MKIMYKNSDEHYYFTNDKSSKIFLRKIYLIINI